MSKEEIFDKLTEAYGGYYNINKDGVLEPFDATGYLSNEARQYFLVYNSINKIYTSSGNTIRVKWRPSKCSKSTFVFFILR